MYESIAMGAERDIERIEDEHEHLPVQEQNDADLDAWFLLIPAHEF